MYVEDYFSPIFQRPWATASASAAVLVKPDASLDAQPFTVLSPAPSVSMCDFFLMGLLVALILKLFPWLGC